MPITSKQVCEDLMTIVWRVKSAMFQVAEAHGLTPVQLFALHAILHGGTTMGRVAGYMHCDASNVTGVIDRLVVQKLVLRAESKSDRRTKTLALTDKGQKLLQTIGDALPVQLGCTQLSNDERQAVRTILNTLSKSVSI